MILIQLSSTNVHQCPDRERQGKHPCSTGVETVTGMGGCFGSLQVKTEEKKKWKTSIGVLPAEILEEVFRLGLSLKFGGLSKLLFQNSITYFLVNQSLI